MTCTTAYRGPGQPTNTLAIIALACGVAQFVTGLSFIPAIILGHMARSQIRRTGEQGDGMALAGLILGYIGGILFIALAAVLIAFWVHLWSKVTGGGGGNYVPQVPSLPSP